MASPIYAAPINKEINRSKGADDELNDIVKLNSASKYTNEQISTTPDSSDYSDSVEDGTDSISNRSTIRSPRRNSPSFNNEKSIEEKIRSIDQRERRSWSITNEKQRYVRNIPIKIETGISENKFNGLHIFCLIIALIFAGFVYNQFKPSVVKAITIEKLEELFPQNEKFWKSIESSISEIKTFEKPSVIILVYRDVSNISQLLDNITIYASCILNDDCHVDPIIIKGNELNTYEIIEDYGIVIQRYRSLLEEKHIMIVKNLDEILGPVAQAFHYICDEYTPLVKRSLILFTMRVDKYEGRELEQVVNILENKWSDIGRDKLEALITRVSSIVLRIK